MKPFNYLPTCIILIMFLLGCGEIQSPYQTVEDVVERIPDVELIPGAGNAAMTVKYDRSYSSFKVTVNNLEHNQKITNGTYHAWCLELGVPISIGEEYTGVKFYSTERDKWLNKITYIVNNRRSYERANPGLSWKDIQVAMWVILETRGYTLEVIEEHLPSEVGGYNPGFVNNILADVQENGKDFVPGFGGKHIVMGNTNTNDQIIGVERAWAWIGGPFTETFEIFPGYTGEHGWGWVLKYNFPSKPYEGDLYITGQDPTIWPQWIDDYQRVGTVFFSHDATKTPPELTVDILTKSEHFDWNMNEVGVWAGTTKPTTLDFDTDPLWNILKYSDGDYTDKQRVIVTLNYVPGDLYLMVYAKGYYSN